VRIGALAMKQRAPKLFLQLSDRTRQRRLGDFATLGRLCEIEILTQRKKISDLMHLHHGTQLAAQRRQKPDSVIS
jgi:hypothetical protein